MKNRWREKMRATLAEMSPETAADKSRLACAALTRLAEFSQSQVVMLYMAIPDEADPAEAALAAWKSGKTVLVPRVSWARRSMKAVEIHSLHAGLVRTSQGIDEPTGGKVWPVDRIDMVVVPALAFDRFGNRLGRGGGFYDRFLASPQLKAITCGLAFSQQLVGPMPLPVHDHDCPVDLLVTDKDVLHFDSHKRG